MRYLIAILNPIWVIWDLLVALVKVTYWMILVKLGRPVPDLFLKGGTRPVRTVIWVAKARPNGD